MPLDIQHLKQNYHPMDYYRNHLSGGFGKPTGKGWHLWNGLCPFHADRQAGSFVINKETGAFKCFSCGESGGDIIDFHAKHHHLSTKDAVFSLWEDISCKK